MRPSIFFQGFLTLVIGAGAILPAKAWDGHPPAVSPAIAPGFPGAPGQEGRSSIEREADFPCLNNGSVVILKVRVAVSKAATITSTGGSAALSFLGTGFSGGLNRTNVEPNFPQDQFDQQLNLARADTIISCAALGSKLLREQELNWALRTQQVLRRAGGVTGFAASEEAQQAYREARKRAGNHHPNLAAADQAANQGRYEEATQLLTK